MKKISIFVALVLFMFSLSFANAQAARTVSLDLKEVSPAKVNGKATITEVAGGGVTVSVELTGYTANQKSAGHIHSGQCTPGGPVVNPLTTITADGTGKGSATTTLATVKFDDLIPAPGAVAKFYVQYHIADAPAGVQVSCGDILFTASAGAKPAPVAGGQGGATVPAAAPAAGIGGAGNTDSSFNFLPFVLAGLVTVGAGATLALARRKRQG